MSKPSFFSFKMTKSFVIISLSLVLVAFAIWFFVTDLPTKMKIENSFNKITIPKSLEMVKKEWYPKGIDVEVSAMDYKYQTNEDNIVVINQVSLALQNSGYSEDITSDSQDGSHFFINKSNKLSIKVHLSGDLSNLSTPSGSSPYYVWMIVSRY